MQIEFGA